MSLLDDRLDTYARSEHEGAPSVAKLLLETITALESSLLTHAEALVLLNQLDDMRAGQIRTLRARVDSLEAAAGDRL